MPKLDLAALAYLRHVLLQMKLSPSALAKKAGLSSTTLTRALNDPDHKFTLTTTTIQKIADASGINPAPFLQAEDVVQLSLAPIYRKEVHSRATDFFGPPSSTAIVGEVHAGKWIEPDVFPPSRHGFVDLAGANLKPMDYFCIIVGDQSFDEYAQRGDILFCWRPDLYGGPTSDLVLVERRDTRNFRIELTARRLIRLAVASGALDFWRLDSASRTHRFEPIELSSLAPTPELKILTAPTTSRT
jgi:transcriptional regulator with XRE-family HTH domain